MPTLRPTGEEVREAGWVLRYRRGGKALTTLSPQAGEGFVALVVVGPSAWEAVEASDVSEPVKAAFRAATPHADGRWLWLQVRDTADARDVIVLVTFKSPPPRHVRRPQTGRCSPDGP